MRNCEEGLFYMQFNMEPDKMKLTNKTLKKDTFAKLLKGITKKVSAYFEPEEVEVTFEEGEKEVGSYTYTVVPHHKQVA